MFIHFYGHFPIGCLGYIEFDARVVSSSVVHTTVISDVYGMFSTGQTGNIIQYGSTVCNVDCSFKYSIYPDCHISFSKCRQQYAHGSIAAKFNVVCFHIHIIDMGWVDSEVDICLVSVIVNITIVDNFNIFIISSE